MRTHRITQTSPGRPEMTWVAVRDSDGRTRMEMRWHVPAPSAPITATASAA